MNISNKHGLCQFPQKLMSNLRLRILENLKISIKSPNFKESLPSAQSPYPNENFISTSKNLLKNRN